ncbi:hypothetical protein [Marinomonas balearica]|uniref:hypothetical protein n=1 Tax=Marinomonas balearica TaxID=491947 RepID=UPI00141504A9|nr:hypothetical protein [Marinomonas balearica]
MSVCLTLLTITAFYAVSAVLFSEQLEQEVISCDLYKEFRLAQAMFQVSIEATWCPQGVVDKASNYPINVTEFIEGT